MGQTVPSAAPGRGGWSPRTAISRVIVLHSARASCACHFPGDGDATSTNQKYGGPPCRSFDLPATLPLGAISDSSPSSGFSAANTTRNGAPFHGVIGEDTTASSAASSQPPAGAWACASTAEKSKTKHAPATSNDAVATAVKPRAATKSEPLPDPHLNDIGALWLNHGKIRAGERPDAAAPGRNIAPFPPTLGTARRRGRKFGNPREGRLPGRPGADLIRRNVRGTLGSDPATMLDQQRVMRRATMQGVKDASRLYEVE